MRTGDLLTSAVSNTFRSRTRTLLTILAIFVGAFTLTLTNGLGTGINAYIDDTVSGVGASDAMTVTRTIKAEGRPGPGGDDGPRAYDPNALAVDGPGMSGTTVSALIPDDIAALEDVEGVLDVDPNRSISPDYVQLDGGDPYVANVGSLVPGQTAVLAVGSEPSNASADAQVALPVTYVEPLGFTGNEDAIGQTVTLAITDADRTQHTIDAVVVGITEEALASPTGSSLLVNDSLADTLFETQSTGLTAEQAERYPSATVWFSPEASEEEVTALKNRLADDGFTGTTIADQLGTITSVIDGIVLVLNAFAVIALLAAGFGIVNTLFMSVQERTREIGLMKAMGMGSGRVFALFSLEAAFLGFLGAAIGSGIAILAGTAISDRLAGGLFADLPGLDLIAFDPVAVAATIALIMVLAFVAGTMPAARAARADPVDSLRYE